MGDINPMKIARITPISFRSANNRPEKVSPKQSDTQQADRRENSFGNKIGSKSIQYVIAASILAISAATYIVGRKKGWFSLAKKSKIKQDRTEDMIPEVMQRNDNNIIPNNNNTTENIMQPIDHYTNFARRLDYEIDGDVRKAEEDYAFIDMLTYEQYDIKQDLKSSARPRRYKKDFVKYLRKFDNDDRIKVGETTVTQNWYSGHPRTIYTFEEGLNGELVSIKECPKDKKGKYRVLTFNPKKYSEETNIHYLEKVEFFDAQTDKLEKSITIPENRAFHNAVIMNPKTGTPRIILNRTAEPDNFYYELTAFDKKDGKPIFKLDTKNKTLSTDLK